MDIEGAEYGVIEDLITSDFKVRQLITYRISSFFPKCRAIKNSECD